MQYPNKKKVLDRNFVFFVCTDTDEKFVFHDFFMNKNIRIINKAHFFSSHLLSFAFRFSFSQEANKKFGVTGKRIWFKLIARRCVFENNNPVVLVFSQGWHNVSFVRWLKRRHPELRRIIYFDDTIQFCTTRIARLYPDLLKNQYDCVLSYNPADVKQYGFTFSRVYFSKIPVENLQKLQKVDLVFIGNVKDRLSLIISIYQKLHKKVKCNFVVVGVKKRTQVEDGITYRSTYIPYLSYLENEIAGNCILEILKGDTQGCSYRVWEAVYYNKKLLTNWKGIFSFPYYNPKYMRYFETADDIDVDFLQSGESVNYGYSNENSPIHLLELIDKILDKEKASHG